MNQYLCVSSSRDRFWQVRPAGLQVARRSPGPEAVHEPLSNIPTESTQQCLQGLFQVLLALRQEIFQSVHNAQDCSHLKLMLYRLDHWCCRIQWCHHLTSMPADWRVRQSDWEALCEDSGFNKLEQWLSENETLLRSLVSEDERTVTRVARNADTDANVATTDGQHQESDVSQSPLLDS